MPAVASGPNVRAKSGILIDGATGGVLWQNNAHQRLPIASTTKIMTAIVVLENANLNGRLVVSKGIEKVGQSEIGLIRKEKVSVKELLEAMLVHSANDAAVALANYTSGDTKKFAVLMNKKAQKIGVKDSHFSNPDGLSDKNHYSTAYDLAIISRYAMQKPLFKRIVAMKKTVVHGKKRRSFPSRNKLLLRYSPAIGIKTGYTKPAGYCLVSAAEKKGRFLIGTTLGAKTIDESFNNAENILEYGYKSFDYNQLALKGKSIKSIEVPYSDQKLPLLSSGSSGYFLGTDSQISSKIVLSDKQVFPIKKDSIRGWLIIKKDGKVVSKTALLAGKSFLEPTFWEKTTFTMSKWFDGFKGFFKQLSFE